MLASLLIEGVFTCYLTFMYDCNSCLIRASANIFPLNTLIFLGYSPPQGQTSAGTMVLRIGLVTREVNIMVVDCEAPFTLLLGRPWLHENKAIIWTLHQKMKMITPHGVIAIPWDTTMGVAVQKCHIYHICHLHHDENDNGYMEIPPLKMVKYYFYWLFSRRILINQTGYLT